VVTVADLLHRRPDASEAEVREALAGNLCRCTGYEKILEAVRLAAAAGAGGPGSASTRSAAAGSAAADFDGTVAGGAG
jgi:carbon-monoxide dehydrogenase small subunit